MTTSVSPIVKGLVPVVLAVGALLALSSWATAPLPQKSLHFARTARFIVQAPFADAILIGDSRLQLAEPTDRAMVAGYNGATFEQLERVAWVLCKLSNAPVVVALGVNDARIPVRDVEATLASAGRMVETCKADRLSLSAIWPTESEIEPFGSYYDTGAVAEIDQGLQQIAQEKGVTIVPPPDLSDHTSDGVHFKPEVSRLYVNTLADQAELLRETS